MGTPLIEIKNLSAGYDSRTVLRNVNLTVYDRDFLGIIGPNGGGKTTLIKCILGLLKPTGGEILYRVATTSGNSSAPHDNSTANSQFSTLNSQPVFSMRSRILSRSVCRFRRTFKQILRISAATNTKECGILGDE